MATLEKRLKAVEFKSAKLQKCRVCQKILGEEKAFCVPRYTPTGTHSYEKIMFWYCTDCVKSPEEVIDIVDTDSYFKGIAGVDSAEGFVKKNAKSFEPA